jgi:hypothetical protein
MSQATAAKNPKTRYTELGWSVERFADFWSDPHPELVPLMVTEDVLGWWPGAEQPVRGAAAYTQALADLLKILPDIRLRVAEHAGNGDDVFIRWIMRASGKKGPFEFTGIDRIRMRGGLVAENIIRFDSAHLQRLIAGA